ncbi:hypothetical protein DFH06DRAFT_1467440 [Mycena polygramma]|nr:hypothetical protein DFH06DRAFT_1467440 [Mycena polygramma]
MNSPGPPASSMVSKVVAAAGPVKLRAYMEQMFSPELVAIGYYTADNAETWLDVEKFMRWLSFQAQKSTATPPATPSKPRPGSSYRLPPSSSPAPDTPSSSLPPIPPPQFRNKTAAHPTTSSPVYDSDDDAPPAPRLPPRKRKRGASAASGSDSDCVEVIETKTKPRRKQKKRDVAELLPRGSWTVPRPDEEDYAYLLDLTDDTREWWDSNKQLLSMAAIIKLQDQDAWGGGSAGSTSLDKATKVLALGGVPCQVANHQCQGVCVCTLLNLILLNGFERYEPDDDEMRELFEAERDVNLRETSSVAIRAAA